MPLLNKRTGTQEEFNRAKLEESITRAGATEETAREIASRIDPTTVNTTEEIRRCVVEELRKTDAAIAERYKRTRILAARKAVEAAMGTVRLHMETMKALGANPGDSIIVEHRGNTHTLTAETARVEMREIHLHESDLEKLGATEGTRLATRRST
ncbi:MAG: ATP cone domain-containing protein [Thermoplasmata archaeon]